jgi:TP901 family phage tail tape measure protein
MASGALDRQKKQLDANQLATLRYQQRIAALRAEQMRFVQMGAGFAAVGGFLAIGTAVADASKFQLVMTSIQNVTEASASQMERLYNATFNVGNKTAMNATEVAEMFREIARSAQGSTLGFQGMLNILPYAAKMQTVLGPTRGMSPEQTVDTTMALVHLFRQYYEAGTPKMMDTVLRMFELSPISPAQMLRQMTYFVPMLKALNTPNEQAATMMTFLARAGFGSGKGGTGVAMQTLQSLGPLQITSFAQAHKHEMLVKLGLLNKDGTSPFVHPGGPGGKPYYDLFQELAQVSKASQLVGGGANAVKTLTSIFGTTGGRVAMLMADPDLVKQLQSLEKIMTTQASLGLKPQSEKIMDTVSSQWKRMIANFNSLMIEMGVPWLRALTDLFRSIGDALHNAQAWMHQHPRAEKAIGAGAAVGSTVLAGVALSGIIGAAGKILGFGGGIGILGGGAGGLFGGVLGSLRRAGTDIAKIFTFSPGGKGIIGQGVSGMMKPDFLRDLGMGLRNIPGIRQLLTALDHLGGVGKLIAGIMDILVHSSGLLIRTLFAFGLRLLNVVGWALLVKDALQFFLDHPKEIGAWVAKIIWFFRATLIPQTIKAMQTFVPLILGAFWNMLKGMLDMILHPGRFVAAAKDMMKAINDYNWQQQHINDIAAARASAQHAKENEQRYADEQRKRAFANDRVRRQEGTNITIQSLVLPGVKTAKDIHPALMNVDKLTQGSPRIPTDPRIAFPLNSSFAI